MPERMADDDTIEGVITAAYIGSIGKAHDADELARMLVTALAEAGYVIVPLDEVTITPKNYTADNPPPWINRHRNEG